ncbi:hypothetical protein [Eleftheria terrae]|uniref:hypothetical protein n=1 Tax=Eleftheria terrae TaxID=1597781 RepID=UPI00263AD2CA|nr:hypothetical protein [Eleftheria terrae]WKB54620.1 hypothetical protein N7L95_09670 [Eleftheria terrae]
MQICLPADDEIRSLQSQEQGFYWSACCDNLLRKHGVIPWPPATSPGTASLRIFTRGGEPGDCTDPVLLEGPLSASALRQWGLVAQNHEASSLQLHAAAGRKLSPFEYPRAMLLAKHPVTGARGEPYLHVPAERRHHRVSFQFQSFEPANGWKPVLFASQGEADERLLAVAVTDGRRLALGIPLIDLLCSMMAWPPLPDGYFRMASELPSTSLELWLVDALHRLATDNRVPWIRVAPWPGGSKWACTVRADYDRPITDTQLRRLLAVYERHHIRASWCFLEWNCPAHQTQLLARAGHEAALHTGARTQQDFDAEIASIELETGLSLAGVTSHGGDYVGFLGDMQYQWAEQAGMRWSESIGRVSRWPNRVVHIVDGIPRTSRLMLMPTHSSLDAGTKPDQHYLDRVIRARKSAVAEGGHFVFMNHPDLHEAQVVEALHLTGLPQPWSATFDEVARWAGSSKYDIELQVAADGVHAVFAEPVGFDFSIESESGAGRRVVPVAAGATRIKVI